MADSCYNFDLEPPGKKMKLDDFSVETVLPDHLVTDDNIQFPSSSGVEKLSSQGIMKEENSDEEGGSGSDDDCSSNDGNVVIVHMDIREPLSTLRSLLQKKVNLDLTLHVFTLQGNQQLESSKTLVDQCIQGEGIVQINVKIRENTKPKAIDIVDVLKPDDDYNEDLEQDVSMAKEAKLSTNEQRFRFIKAIQQAKDGVSLPNGWIQDIDFTYKLIRYSIPINPMEWEPSHVKHWLLWAVREFNLVGINLQDWANMPGYLLCAMSQKDFNRRVQQDPGDVFWQHCQILKVYKTVAVRTKDRMKNLKDLDTSVEEAEDESQKEEAQVDDRNDDRNSDNDDSNQSNSESHVSYLNMDEKDPDSKSIKPSFGSVKLQQFQHFMGRQNDIKGLGASISLWQFLLELLIDWRYRDCIQWVGTYGEFEMLQPDIVAKMWGIRKNKPNMNYDKLSRALRYYYDGDMIAKVCGKKYVYRFISDLKFLLGYSPKELNERVIKAEKRFKKKDK